MPRTTRALRIADPLLTPEMTGARARRAYHRAASVRRMARPSSSSRSGSASSSSRTPTRCSFPKAKKTKRDLAEYYIAVGDGIVRALYERPTQLRRFPDGVTGEAIYQKRVPEKRPEWVETARVTFPSGRHADELCVTELAQVVWAANLAVVDFHPWPSRRRDTEHPDELRIDIDPQPGTTFRDGKRSRRSCARCSTRSATWAGRRPRGTAASTSSAASSRTGSSRSCAGRRSRSRARSSGACRRRSRPRGGRRSAAGASSSTTTRTRATGRWHRPTRCAGGRTRRCRRR